MGSSPNQDPNSAVQILLQTFDDRPIRLPVMRNKSFQPVLLTAHESSFMDQIQHVGIKDFFHGQTSKMLGLQ